MKRKRRTHLELESLEGRALLSGLSGTIATNQAAYQPGEPVEMTFTETNTTGGVISVSDGPSIDGFDVSQNGNMIWRSNAGINPMFIRMVPLQPGQSLTLTATWDGIPTGGTSPVTGTFTVQNQLDPTQITTVAIKRSTTPPGTPASPPNGQPIGVTDPGPVPAPVNSPTSPEHPIGTPVSVEPVGVPATTDTGSGSTPIVVSVATNHPSYHKGQKVRMTVTLENTGGDAVSLARGSSGRLTLLEGTTPIWHRASIVGKAGHRLRPGHSVTLSAVWNGKAHDVGVSMSTGTYTLVASAGGTSASTTFQVA